MRNCLLFVLTLLVSFSMPFAPSAQTQFHNTPFKDIAGAQVYVGELRSLMAGADRVNQATKKYDRVMQENYDAMVDAFNTSASEVEMTEKFRANTQAFDMLRAELDLAIKFADQNAQNAQFDDARGLSSETRRVLQECRRSADLLQQAYNDFDYQKIDIVWDRMSSVIDANKKYWNDHLPQIKDNLKVALGGMDIEADPNKQVDCPYEFGSYQYMLNCVEAGELATSGSE